MKKILLLLVIVTGVIYSQTIPTLRGKALNAKGEPMAGLEVKMYASSRNYTAYTSGDGTFSFSNVTDAGKKEILPSGYSVSNNYPNPFNPKTRINFDLPQSSNVRIELFNAIGENVGRQLESNFSSGSNYADLELNGLPNGIYIARVTIDGKYSVIRKLVLEYGSQHLNAGNSAPAATAGPLAKTQGDIKIDSLVFSGLSIPKNVFVNLPLLTAGVSDLGNVYINPWGNGSPCYGTPTIMYSGKVYNTVQIGTQCWLRENIDLGTMVDAGQDQYNNGVVEKYCYANQISSCTEYGGMYQWEEALGYKKPDSGKVQGICPSGWHIPSTNDIDILSKAPEIDGNGNKLKKEGWGSKDGLGTNTSGFSAYLVGNRHVGGLFFSHGDPAAWWTINEYDPDEAFDLLLSWYYSGIFTYTEYKSSGLFVRCLRD